MKRTHLLLGVVSGVAISSGYWLGLAHGSGPPATEPLAYSGVVTDGGGEPLGGMHSVHVRVWDDAAAGVEQCSQGPAQQELVQGRFRVVLPPPCLSAVQAKPELWVEVLIDGTPLGRTKIGAVPYAIETGRALTANNAHASFDVPGTLTAQAVRSSGPLLRRVARTSGYGSDEADLGPLAGRSLTIMKLEGGTGLRVGYVDTFRAYGSSPENYITCQWEIRFNGARCATPGPLVYGLLMSPGATNHHRSNALFGTCDGLPAGPTTITVSVGLVPGEPGGDCQTGWGDHLWSIEAEEVL